MRRHSIEADGLAFTNGRTTSITKLGRQNPLARRVVSTDVLPVGWTVRCARGTSTSGYRMRGLRRSC